MRLTALTLLLLSACSVDHAGLGPDMDASVSRCMSAIDCDLGEPCITYACDEGMCRSTGCGVGLMCDGRICVPRSSCDSNLCEVEGANPDRCAVGECQGELCASVSTCSDNTLCCEAGCSECPDLEADPCMQAACEGAACGREPRPAGTPCNVNGNFCDGFGLCDEFGGCTVNIESCGDVCNESEEECVGCVADDDCPDRVRGNNCATAIGLNECTATVTPMRTRFTCNSKSLCEQLGDPQPDPPIRCNLANGTICRDTTFSSYVPCEYSSDCVQSGVTRRTRSDFTCEGGRADPSFMPASCDPDETSPDEFDRCDRLTGGQACSAPPAEPDMGVCDYMNMCDENATRDVTPYVSLCEAGSCDIRGGTGTSTAVACTRVLSGNECGTTTYTGWSACTQSGTTCRGTRTRERTDFTCGSDACQMMTTTETDSDCVVANFTECGAIGVMCEADDSDPGNAANCIGRRRRPTCGGGTCRNGRFVQCDRIGGECRDSETTCLPSAAGDCTGTESTMTYTCSPASMCTGTPGLGPPCTLDSGETCGVDSDCSTGTCDGAGTCDAAVDCGVALACGGSPCTGGDSCGCGGSGTCICE